jgi:hypothetical protein
VGVAAFRRELPDLPELERRLADDALGRGVLMAGTRRPVATTAGAEGEGVLDGALGHGCSLGRSTVAVPRSC